MNTQHNRKGLEQLQLERLREMLQAVLPANEFYRKKFSANKVSDIASIEILKSLPFTTKSELVENQALYPPFGIDLTFSQERYIRIHQTSGTTGKPMYWLDTEESWHWRAECWKTIFEAANVSAGDRIYFAFSFGRFIGIWAGWESTRKLVSLAASGGSPSTV